MKTMPTQGVEVHYDTSSFRPVRHHRPKVSNMSDRSASSSSAADMQRGGGCAGPRHASSSSSRAAPQRKPKAFNVRSAGGEMDDDNEEGEEARDPSSFDDGQEEEERPFEATATTTGLGPLLDNLRGRSRSGSLGRRSSRGSSGAAAAGGGPSSSSPEAVIPANATRLEELDLGGGVAAPPPAPDAAAGCPKSQDTFTSGSSDATGESTVPPPETIAAAAAPPPPSGSSSSADDAIAAAPVVAGPSAVSVATRKGGGDSFASSVAQGTEEGFAAAAAAASAAAAAAVPSTSSFGTGLQSKEGFDSSVVSLGLPLGLSRRHRGGGRHHHHRRRASYPPKSMTQSDLERGYDAIRQLRHMHGLKRRPEAAGGGSRSGGDLYEDNLLSAAEEEEEERPGSVRFDDDGGGPSAPRECVTFDDGSRAFSSDDYVRTDSGRLRRFRQRRRSREDSNVSAAEWATNPLEKERDMIMRASSNRNVVRDHASQEERRQGRLKRKRKKKSAAGALNEKSRKEYTFVLGAGMCLAFNSGYINGACLSGLLVPSGARVSVSAFTGTYTKSALNLADGNGAESGFLIGMILCFVGGSMLTSIINPRAKPYELGPTYGPTFLLGSLFLVISSILSELDYEHNGLFYFAAAANGLQNGMSSTYSGNLIRSSHYTGISTDIGLILGQVLRGNRTSLWKLWVLLGLTASFWLGGFVSWHATSHFRTHSLIFNAVFFFLIGVGLIVFVAFLNQVTVLQAAFGTWQWERALESLTSAHHHHHSSAHHGGGGDSLIRNGSVRDSITDSSGRHASEEFLLGLFDEIDADRSGTIDENELYESLRRAGMKVSRKGIRAMMKLADEDGDGTIDKDEWTALVTGKVDVQRNKSNDGAKGGMSAKEAADQALKEMEEAGILTGRGREDEANEGGMRNEEKSSAELDERSNGLLRQRDGLGDIEEGGGQDTGDDNGFCRTRSLSNGVEA